MSTVKSKKLQVGTDATSSNNFTIYQPATPDGTLRIGVGNADNPTEVGRFNSNGYVATNAPAFRVKQSSGQALSQSTFTKLTLNSEDFDTASMFDATTNYRFQPTVEGYYQISGTVGMASGGNRLIVAIYKNGSDDYKIGDATYNNVSGSGLVYLNGSTDYVELYARTDRSGGDTTQEVRFTGHLARAV